MTSTAKNYAKKIHLAFRAKCTLQQIDAYQKDQELIQAMRRLAALKFGPRHLRVTANGEIHVYSLMPNATKTGWWFVGSSAKEAYTRLFDKE